MLLRFEIPRQMSDILVPSSRRKVVFTWEWGAGNGHLRRFLPIAVALQDQGHEVVVVARDLPRAQAMFSETKIQVLPTPTLPLNRQSVLRMPQTFAGLAWNLGVHDPEQLYRCLGQWKALLEDLRPSHVVSDFGMVSGYVANALKIPLARIGLGFGTPPPGAVLQGMFGQEPSSHEWSLAEQICESFQVLSTPHRLSSPNDWEDIFTATGPTLLASNPDFDPYRRHRERATYLGTWSRDTGVQPPWQGTGRVRAIAYLKTDASLVEQCRRLSSLEMEMVLVCDGPVPDAMHSIPRLTISAGLLKTDPGEDPYQLVVCNANHGLTVRAIELGIPVLMVPLYVEQRWNAQVVEQLGYGLNLSQHADYSWPAAIKQLLTMARSDKPFHDYSQALRQSNAESLPKAIARVLHWLES